MKTLDKFDRAELDDLALEQSTRLAALARQEKESPQLRSAEDHRNSTPFPTAPTWSVIAFVLVLSLKLFGYNIIAFAFGIDATLKAQYYGVLCTALGCLVGFQIASLPLFLGIKFDTVFPEFVEAGLLRPIFRAFILAIKWSLLSLIFAVIGMFFDKTGSGWKQYIIEFTVLASFGMAVAYLSQTIAVIGDLGKDLLKGIEDGFKK